MLSTVKALDERWAETWTLCLMLELSVGTLQPITSWLNLSCVYRC